MEARKNQELANIAALVKSNDIEKLKTALLSHNTQLNTGYWDYFTEGNLIECAARDAILAGHEEVLRLLFKAGLSTNAHAYKDDINRYDEKLIQIAAKSGRLNMVKLLVESGAEIYSDDRDRWNEDYGLRTAVITGHADIVDYLLEHGAEAEGLCGGGTMGESHGGTTFLARAAEDGNIPIVESLIKHGAKVTTAIDLAYEKLYVHQYQQYRNAIERIERSYNKKKKIELQQKADEFKNSYARIVKTCLDYAFGADFEDYKGRGLEFLADLDVSGMNFIGVSLAGRPVTRALLEKQNLPGSSKAIVTFNDLIKLDDIDRARFKALGDRLYGNLQIKGELIDNNGIVNLVPLYRAAEIGDIAAVLARTNAFEVPDKETLTVAAKNGHFEIVKILYAARYNQDKTAINEAIEAARKQKHDEIVAFLQDQQDVNQADEKGDTLLHKAVIDGDVDRVRELIGKGADVNQDNKEGRTPLSFAAEYSGSEWGVSEKHAEIVQLLLAKNADPDKYEWKSPLTLSVKAGNAKVVSMLLPVTTKKELIKKVYLPGSGKHTNVSYPWYTDMLFEAVHKKNGIELLTLLKEYGADFNTKSKYNDTLLNEAVYALPSFSDIRTYKDLISDDEKRISKELRMLDFLLANGADPHLPGRDGQTPLALLIAKKDLSHLEKSAELIMDRFVKHGADVNATDSMGNTPLHAAADTGDFVAIEYLISHGAKVNAVNNSKRTPLHCAAASGSPKSAKLLLENGADYDLTDEDGLIPSQAAEKAMAHDKKVYTFSSPEDERENESKYIAVKNEIANAKRNISEKLQLQKLKELHVNALTEDARWFSEAKIRSDKLVDLYDSQYNTFVTYFSEIRSLFKGFSYEVEKEARKGFSQRIYHFAKVFLSTFSNQLTPEDKNYILKKYIELWKGTNSKLDINETEFAELYKNSKFGKYSGAYNENVPMLAGFDLSNIRLSDQYDSDLVFPSVNMNRATFTNLELPYCYFENCNIREVKTLDADRKLINLNQGRFIKCDLRNTDLENVALCEGYFSGCKIHATKFPKGFSIVKKDCIDEKQNLAAELSRQRSSLHSSIKPEVSPAIKLLSEAVEDEQIKPRI